MTTYTSGIKSINDAKTIERLRQLYNVFKYCYEWGLLTFSEYRKLDLKLLDTVISFEFKVDDLGWDYERMSEGGQKVYKKLCKKLGWTFEWEDE